eukprot:3986627-Karenia_brevis.AAC.1
MEAVRALQSKVAGEMRSIKQGGSTGGSGGSEGADRTLQRERQIVFRNFPEKFKRRDITNAIWGFLDGVQEGVED